MYMPRQAALAINDLLDNCAAIQAGQQVLILAATEGLGGGVNLVDETTVAWIQAGVQQRGAYPSVLWVDVSSQPHAWRVPPIAKAAISGADVLISHAFDLPFEELYELRDLLKENSVPMIRNMATTVPLLTSAWAQTPYELVAELRFQTASLFSPGVPWSLDHPNGTHLIGVIGDPLPPFKHYAERRGEGLYRPFPEGVFTPIRTVNAEGELVFDRTLSWWARYIGVPPRLTEPIRLRIEQNRIRDIEGGQEAKTLKSFFESMAERFGDTVYEIAGLHGGVHPHASVTPDQCPDGAYREFIEHHHSGSTHLHLGHIPRTAEYPYMLHITAELREATLRVNDALVYDRGRLSALDHPAVRAIAARYPDRPAIV